MVQMYFDRDADVDHRQKREDGFAERMPLLLAAIARSTQQNDPTFQEAFAHWIASLRRRISQHRPLTLKLPQALQRARLLPLQEVRLMRDDALYARIGEEDVLLYPVRATNS